MSENVKAGIRRLLRDQGRKVQFEEGYFAGRSYKSVSTHGWSDWESIYHIKDGCSWVIPEGVVVHEETYSMFAGTFTSNRDEVGLNADGCHCKCGLYKNVTLRLTTSLGAAIQSILGYDASKSMQL